VFYNATLYKQQSFQSKRFKSVILEILVFNYLNFSGVPVGGGGRKPWIGPPPGYLKEIEVEETKEIYQILLIELFLYPDYSKAIIKISLREVYCTCIRKFCGFPLGKRIAPLEEVLLAPKIPKLSSNKQASFNERLCLNNHLYTLELL
jgi:hypothetical protein